jgi:nitrite reductase (NADH) small subunit
MSTWVEVADEREIAPRAARRFRYGATPVAVFRAGDGALFALVDRCPHKEGPLSEGIVHGRAVTCPLHNWVISLETGQAQGADSGCTAALAVEVRQGRVFVDVGPLARAPGVRP